ncbi:MAG TPA: class I SAM-dependent methyltransferase [Vicinamibacterales bacterium]|nr:class I SAM-dependent methyltransferase [Vicinamibacterales bacterium]
MGKGKGGRGRPRAKGKGKGAEGWRGWDEYAPFYDWENARTVARRDLVFWQRLAAAQDGPVLELGCGTGRVAIPVARAGAALVGIDRSAAMLARARRRLARARLLDRTLLVRGDIRALPFRRRRGFALVMAPYGILQSLTSERDLLAALRSVAAVLRKGALFAIDLVPDLPRWSEYRRRLSLRGRKGRATTLALVESVRQDRPRRMTRFDQEYVVRRGRTRRVHRFSLSFRTLSVPEVCRRLERAGFRIDAVLGDYRGGPWDDRADVWIILARKR